MRVFVRAAISPVDSLPPADSDRIWLCEGISVSRARARNVVINPFSSPGFLSPFSSWILYSIHLSSGAVSRIFVLRHRMVNCVSTNRDKSLMDWGFFLRNSRSKWFLCSTKTVVSREQTAEAWWTSKCNSASVSPEIIPDSINTSDGTTLNQGNSSMKNEIMKGIWWDWNMETDLVESSKEMNLRRLNKRNQCEEIEWNWSGEIELRKQYEEIELKKTDLGRLN